MALVSYSDSEESGDEAPQAVPATLKKVTATAPKPTTKPVVQKLVGPSNPHKIKISLPEIQDTSKRGDEEVDGPPAKRAKTGSGAFSGFNSFLPAPKRSAATNGGSGPKRGGLGSGVNLKTGATPGFSREPVSPYAEDSEMPGASGRQEMENTKAATPVEAEESSSEVPSILEKLKAEPKKTGSAMMFKPLSVARKPQVKKAVSTPKPVEAVPVGPSLRSKPEPEPRKLVRPSLFSLPSADDSSVVAPGSIGEYKPMVYEAKSTRADQEYSTMMDGFDFSEQDPDHSHSIPTPSSTIENTPQSLDAIAADLNLSKSARRQLMGRGVKGETSAINVLNFNTDEEYASNELLRQAGETVKVNPVRAISAGKHSLKQLINAASSQKEALEEHFASGKRNKKEAGSKYGW